MNRHTRGVIAKVAVTLALLAGVPALAQNQNGQGQNNQGGGKARSVPEFDPSTAGVIAAIVAGGGVLLARRRRNS